MVSTVACRGERVDPKASAAAGKQVITQWSGRGSSQCWVAAVHRQDGFVASVTDCSSSQRCSYFNPLYQRFWISEGSRFRVDDIDFVGHGTRDLAKENREHLEALLRGSALERWPAQVTPQLRPLVRRGELSVRARGGAM